MTAKLKAVLDWWPLVLILAAVIGFTWDAFKEHAGKASAEELEAVKGEVAGIRESQASIEGAHASQEARLGRIERSVERVEEKVDRLIERVK